jgi:hypothetical protein
MRKAKRLRPEKAGPSCHHCRRNHIACDGLRPCSNCIKKKRDCFDYDRNLIIESSSKSQKKKERTKSNESTSDDSVITESGLGQGGIGNLLFNSTPVYFLSSVSQDNPVNVSVNDFIALRTQLTQSESRIQLLETQNQMLQQMLSGNQQNIQMIQNVPSTSNSVQISEPFVYIWGVPDEIKTPLIIIKNNSYKIIGCNHMFLSWIGHTLEDIRNMNDLFSIIVERYRTSWRIIMQWLLSSIRKTFQAYVLIVLKNSREVCVQLKGHLESCFIWLEFIPSDHFSDEFIIDEFCLPATLYVPYSANSKESLMIPTQSFQRLLDTLCSIKKKSLFDKQKIELRERVNTLQNQRLESAPSATFSSFETDTLRSTDSSNEHLVHGYKKSLFKPLEFQEDELSNLITRYSSGSNASVNASSSNSGLFNVREPPVSNLSKEWSGAAKEKETVGSQK